MRISGRTWRPYLTLLLVGVALPAGAEGGDAVQLTEDDNTFTMSNGTLQVQVSKESGDLVSNDGALVRHQIYGDWRERSAQFDASLLKAGTNTIALTVPQGSPNDGVIYDYLRLELDEDAHPLN